MRVVDARAARRGHQVPGDLGRAGRPGVDDHHLLTVAADPDGLPGELVRHRVLAALERHQRQRVHLAGHPQRRGERRRRDRVQPGPLLGQHLRRGAAGDPVRPGVDLLAEHLAGRLQRGEGGVVGQQVRVGGHQVRLGDPDRGLRPALGGRVIGHARRDRQPVMPAELHRAGLRTGIPATCSTVTVFSLSVSR